MGEPTPKPRIKKRTEFDPTALGNEPGAVHSEDVVDDTPVDREALMAKVMDPDTEPEDIELTPAEARELEIINREQFARMERMQPGIIRALAEGGLGAESKDWADEV